MECLRIDIASGVADIRLERPPLNLLTQQIRRDLGTLFAELAEAGNVRAVVLSGGASFCAGADMAEFPLRFDRGTARAHAQNGHRMMRNLLRCPQPVAAAVEGPCLGGGYELAMGCDAIIAGRGARIGLPEVRRGIFPGTGGLFLLARRLTPAAAKALATGGDILEAEAAHAAGLVDELVPDGAALEAARAKAAQWAAGPAHAVRAVKDLIEHETVEAFDRHLAREVRAFEDIFQTADAREGNAAFFEKRPPRWNRHSESEAE